MFISRIAKDGREQLTADHLRKSAKYAALFGKKFDLAEICRLAAILHDLGKFSTAFVEYLKHSFAEKEAGKEDSNRGSIIHSTQGAKYIYEFGCESYDFFTCLVSEVCALCIAGHHNELMDIISPDGKTPFIDRLKEDKPSLNYKKILEIAEQEFNLGQEISDIFQKAVNEVMTFCEKCMQKELNIGFMLHLLTKTVYSCLVDADRYDAYCFESNIEAIPAIFSWEEHSNKLESRIATFPKDTEINKIRSMVSDYCYQAASRPKGIYMLCVPTGGGKTLSSLRFALNHAKIHNAEHVIYVIPYLSIIDQTAKEIKQSLGYTENDNYILEHHSNFFIENNDTEQIVNYKLLTSRWDAPIIITTMVQFLESIYSAKASELRKFHNMANSVIIFDEIQSLPLKCAYLFNEVINYLCNFGGSTALLCSATQPPLDKIPKPLIGSNNSLIPDMSDSFRKLKRTNIVDKTKAGGYTVDELGNFVINIYQKEKSCLVVLNTRKDAVELFSYLDQYFKQNNSDTELFHLSTLMYPKHRLRVIDRIKKRKQNIICVSTQLIEAGVDISFNAVIRALSGLDCIIQAAGRCNRHGEDPNGKDVYIVNLSNEDLSKLPEIKDGAEVTRKILEKKPFDLAEEISTYFRDFFYKEKSQMGFPLKEINTSIYEILSTNLVGYQNMSNYGNNIKIALGLGFKSAGDNFSVIEQRVIGVIVLTEESKDLINKYKYSSLDKKNALLSELGRYTVNLYPYQMLNLSKALTLINDELFVLDSYYYDEKLGIVFDPNQKAAIT
jgi:CRISPR-associated endonuclease/helicase Cas3